MKVSKYRFFLFPPGERAFVFILLSAFISLSGAPALADLDSEVTNAFFWHFPPAAEDTAAARVAARLKDPGICSTLALLHVRRSWDSLREETRELLSRYIGDADGRNSQRSASSIYSEGCAAVFGDSYNIRDTAHFRVIYTMSSSSDHKVTSDYLDGIVAELEKSWTVLVDQIGMPSPKMSEINKIRVYLCDILGVTGGILGLTVGTDINESNYTASGEISLDNDYAGVSLHPGVTYIDYASVVFAHEFFHVIQFGMNYAAPTLWLMEATAVWSEEEVCPDVDDYLGYVDERFDNLEDSIDSSPDGTLYVYGSSIFFRHITENSADVPFVVTMWDIIKSTCINLSNAPWCSWTVSEIPLIDSRLDAYSTNIETVYRNFNVANYTKDYVDGESNYFPDVKTTSVSFAGSTTQRSGSLDHLAAYFYKFQCTTCDEYRKLDISFSGDVSPADWRVSLVKNSSQTGFSVEHIDISAGSGALSTLGFGSDFQSAVLIVNNVHTTLDNQSFSVTFSEGPDETVFLQHDYLAGWNIIGLPLDPVSLLPSEAFGMPGVNFFQLKDGKYVTEDAAGQPVSGNAYWAYFAVPTTAFVRGMPSQTTSVQLKTGWNIISLPFDSSVEWSSQILVSDGSSDYPLGSASADALVEQVIYTYDGTIEPGVYNPPHALGSGFTINSWSGFVIRALQDCTLKFPAPG